MGLLFRNGIVAFDLTRATQHFLDARLEGNELDRDAKFEHLVRIGKGFIEEIDHEPPGTQMVAGWFFRVAEEEKFKKIDLWSVIKESAQACPPRTCVEMTKLRYQDLLDFGRHYAKGINLTAEEFANLGMGILHEYVVAPAVDDHSIRFAKPGEEPDMNPWIEFPLALLFIAGIIVLLLCLAGLPLLPHLPFALLCFAPIVIINIVFHGKKYEPYVFTHPYKKVRGDWIMLNQAGMFKKARGVRFWLRKTRLSMRELTRRVMNTSAFL